MHGVLSHARSYKCLGFDIILAGERNRNRNQINTSLERPIEAWQHEEVVVAASPTDRAAPFLTLSRITGAAQTTQGNTHWPVFSMRCLHLERLSPCWVSCGVAQMVVATKGPLNKAAVVAESSTSKSAVCTKVRAQQRCYLRFAGCAETKKESNKQS